MTYPQRGSYLYTQPDPHPAPDPAGIRHYSAMRRLVLRVSRHTVTLAPAEHIAWTCHTPPLEDWRPAMHPDWARQRAVRLTPRAREQAEAVGAVLRISHEAWYFSAPPEIPTEVTPLDTLAERRAAELVKHCDWCKHNGKPGPDVQAMLAEYLEAVTAHRMEGAA